MKTKGFIIVLLSLVSVQFNLIFSQSTNQKTYAEVSVKEGGKWEGRKYIGGTFKNVQKLKLAPEHTDHSFDIRYEGPGWESNKIGYRLYLDWRNAIDIFGKKTEKIILPQVGQDGFDSYHEMSDWGADILKAGKGIGIGSVDRYLNKERLHFYEVDSTIARNTLLEILESIQSVSSRLARVDGTMSDENASLLGQISSAAMDLSTMAISLSALKNDDKVDA